MRIIDKQLLQELSAQAKQNPRLRQNCNLHDSYNDLSQRLLNAVEPRSYIRPHRHLVHPKPESFVALSGRLALITFADSGSIVKIVLIGPKENTYGVDIPVGVWHTIVSLEEGSVFYETKPGPFIPISPMDIAPWAPEEDDPNVGEYLDTLKQVVGLQVNSVFEQDNTDSKLQC